MIKFNFKNKKSGFAILETILYISFFAILSIVVINAMITMMKSFKETKIQSELTQGSSIMERITRETRQAYGIFSINTNGGVNLKLNNKISGTTKTIEFKLSGTDIQFIDNGGNPVNLNPSNILITGLSFSRIDTLKGSAVKMFLSVQSKNDSIGRVESFYNTVVLRGDY